MPMKQGLLIGLVMLSGQPVMAGLSATWAACTCPSGSESIEVGQSTKADACGLAILLRRIDRGMLKTDEYKVYIKSQQIPSPAASEPTDYTVPQNGTLSLPAGVCGHLLVGAHRSPQRNVIKLNWSYF